MMDNASQSVLDRLRSRARRSGMSFQLALQLFCQEEFLRRLAVSQYRERFVLKGGLLLYSLSGFAGRPTMDVDVLMRGISNEIGTVEQVVRSILDVPSSNDCVAYDVVRCAPIAEGREYTGVRVQLVGRVGNTVTPFHIDVAVGDVVVPKPIERKIPTQLDGFSAPVILTYSLESIVAEKLETIIARMNMNSRMKDFYDLYYIAGVYYIDGRELQEAVFQTLQRRGTAYGRDTLERIRGLVRDANVQSRWSRFSRRTLGLDVSLEEVMDRVCGFLQPVFDAIVDERELFGTWDPQERWYMSAPRTVGSED
jgi:predicted nucleotidyltransferase component of viral defense system